MKWKINTEAIVKTHGELAERVNTFKQDAKKEAREYGAKHRLTADAQQAVYGYICRSGLYGLTKEESEVFRVLENFGEYVEEEEAPGPEPAANPSAEGSAEGESANAEPSANYAEESDGLPQD